MRHLGLLGIVTVLLLATGLPLPAAPSDAKAVSDLFARYTKSLVACDANGTYKLLSAKQTKILTLAELQRKYDRKGQFCKRYGTADIDPPTKVLPGEYGAFVLYRVIILKNLGERFRRGSRGTTLSALFAVSENGQWKVIDTDACRLPVADFLPEPLDTTIKFITRWQEVGWPGSSGPPPPGKILVYGPGHLATSMSGKSWQDSEIKRLGKYGTMVNAFLPEILGKSGRRVCVRTGFYLVNIHQKVTAAKYDLWFEPAPKGWLLVAARALPVEPAPDTIGKRRALRWAKLETERLMDDCRRRLAYWVAHPKDKAALRILKGAHIRSFKLVGVQSVKGYPWTSAQVKAHLSCTPQWLFEGTKTITLTRSDWLENPAWTITNVSPQQTAAATITRLVVLATALLVGAALIILKACALWKQRRTAPGGTTQ